MFVKVYAQVIFDNFWLGDMSAGSTPVFWWSLSRQSFSFCAFSKNVWLSLISFTFARYLVLVIQTKYHNKYILRILVPFTEIEIFVRIVRIRNRLRWKRNCRNVFAKPPPKFLSNFTIFFWRNKFIHVQILWPDQPYYFSKSHLRCLLRSKRFVRYIYQLAKGSASSNSRMQTKVPISSSVQYQVEITPQLLFLLENYTNSLIYFRGPSIGWMATMVW